MGRYQCAELVVFPECALTPFFPHWWIEDQAEIDAYFEPSLPGPETPPLFDEAARLSIGFCLGYEELHHDGERTRRFNSAVIVERDGRIVGRYRKIHLPGHADHRPGNPFQNLEKRFFEPGNLGFPVFEAFGAKTGMLICNDVWEEDMIPVSPASTALLLQSTSTA